MSRLTRIGLLAGVMLLASPAWALAINTDFKPVNEFVIHPWWSVKIGPFEFGPSKALVYLFIAALLSISLGIWLRGGLRERPGRFQAFVETFYSFSETQIGRATLPMAQFLRMGRGAVIPLDATVNEEVWILANNHPIARGEIQINDDRIAIAVTGAADVYDYMAGAA